MPLLPLCEAGIGEDAAEVCGYTLVSAFLLGTPVACGLSPGRWCQGVLTEYHVLFVLATDDVRLFAFVRFTTGDAMSKRSKFALITWIGEDVSGLQRAKTGTDKTLVKEVVQVMWYAACLQGSPSSWDGGYGVDSAALTATHKNIVAGIQLFTASSPRRRGLTR